MLRPVDIADLQWMKFVISRFGSWEIVRIAVDYVRVHEFCCIKILHKVFGVQIFVMSRGFKEFLSLQRGVTFIECHGELKGI